MHDNVFSFHFTVPSCFVLVVHKNYIKVFDYDLNFFIFFYFFEEVQVVQIIPEWLHKLSSSWLPECAAWYFRITQVFVWINDPWSRVTWIPTVFTQPEDRSRRVHINIVLSCPLSFWKVLHLGISAGMQVVWGCRPWSLASNFGLTG